MRYTQKYLEEKFTDKELHEINEGILGAIGRGIGKGAAGVKNLAMIKLLGGNRPKDIITGSGDLSLRGLVQAGMTPTRPTHATPVPGGKDPHAERGAYLRDLFLGKDKRKEVDREEKPEKKPEEKPEEKPEVDTKLQADRKPEEYSATEKLFNKIRQQRRSG